MLQKMKAVRTMRGYSFSTTKNRQGEVPYGDAVLQQRHQRVLEFWDRGSQLTISNKEYARFVKSIYSFQLSHDIGKGDITTNSLIKNNKISAVIIAKEDGILAGIEELIFLNKGLKINALKKDGSKIKRGDLIVEIEGNSRDILQRERTFLNLIQRMSGIATFVDAINEKVKGHAKIAATRKTLFGLLDKKAVSVGKGLTHRLNLNDGILIKDNHLKIMNFDISKALQLAENKSKYTEIEVENKSDALKAARLIKRLSSKKNKSAYAMMLDKINPQEIRQIIGEMKKEGLYDFLLLESSGNINQDNVAGYANTGVDIISMGALTNSSKPLDMSLEIK